MFIHTSSSAPNESAKFGWKTRTFCRKKSGKSDCQTRVGQTIVYNYIRPSDLNFTRNKKLFSLQNYIP